MRAPPHNTGGLTIILSSGDSRSILVLGKMELELSRRCGEDKTNFAIKSRQNGSNR